MCEMSLFRKEIFQNKNAKHILSTASNFLLCLKNKRGFEISKSPFNYFHLSVSFWSSGHIKKPVFFCFLRKKA